MLSVELAARCYLAEWYRPELTPRSVDEAIAQLEHALEALGANGSSPRLLAVLAAPEDEVLYGVFSSGSPNLVVEACTAAGFPIERLTQGIDARIRASL